MSIATSPGSQPTMLESRRRLACSSNSTIATTYGCVSSAVHAWRLMVNVTTRPRPETARGATSKLPQLGHMGLGGWKKRPQALQKYICRTPRAPPCQNGDVSGVRAGSLRVMLYRPRKGGIRRVVFRRRRIFQEFNSCCPARRDQRAAAIANEFVHLSQNCLTLGLVWLAIPRSTTDVDAKKSGAIGQHQGCGSHLPKHPRSADAGALRSGDL